MDTSFLSTSVEEVLGQMTTEEKIGLLAGRDRWCTVPIPRLHVPSIKVTDGPNGARGGSFFKMIPAVALPTATCLAASFSTQLVYDVGTLLAAETKARKACCLLAPTINIPRSPLGGRAFEQFSEDPVLAGLMASAFVRGVQDHGVSCTIKHFVANDQEHERNGQDCIISPRPFREIYLRPFQIVQKLAKPWAGMTSYNKVNGLHCSEDEWLLKTLLRDEWGFDGMVMSDWNGTYSIATSIKAGMDLEMPGPAKFRDASLVLHMLKAQKLHVADLDAAALRVLRWVQLLARRNPDLVYSADTAETTRAESQAQDARLARRAATEGIVLLKNDQDVLPITSGSVAVIGLNAKARVLTGGGAAQLRAAWSQSPWQGLVNNKPTTVELDYSLGCHGAKYLPILDEHFSSGNGQARFDLLHFALLADGSQAAEPTVIDAWDTSDMFMYDFSDSRLGRHYITQVRAVFTSPMDGWYEFGLVVTGRGRLMIDGRVIVDLWEGELQEQGTAFLNLGTKEKIGKVQVVRGKAYALAVVHDTRAPSATDRASSAIVIRPGIRIGARPLYDGDRAIQEAVELARSSDKVVVVAGLNADWESEGYDRPDLCLPFRTDELIARVAEANPNTIVVLQAGSAVGMPWLDRVAGVVHAWYIGNETGNAIADIVYGNVNPSGRLPLTFPKREVDIPAALNGKNARGQVHYEEGIWVGYRGYNARGIEPLFPFGHGLSYTSWEIESVAVVEASTSDWEASVEVTVKNIGRLVGNYSVHVYLEPPTESPSGLRHPQRTLQGFDKVYGVAPGKFDQAVVKLDKYAISHWDELLDCWRVEPGEWTVRVGTNAQTMVPSRATFHIAQEITWRGI